MLRAERITYGPPHGPALHENLSFQVAPGEVLHVTGGNGAGKSLLLRCLLGTASLRAGHVRNEFAGTRYLPQMQNRAAHLPFALGDILDGTLADDLLPARQLGLAWNRASGGERQRTLLSRFFAQPGSLLILDEPFNHLDQSTKEKVRRRLRETLANPTCAAILVSHDDEPTRWLGSLPVRRLDLPGGKA